MDEEQPASDAATQIDLLRLEADTAGATLKWPHERAELYQRAFELARAHGMVDLARESEWDFLLFRMSRSGLFGDGEERFGPTFVLADGTKFPDPEQLPTEALEYYAARAQTLVDPVLHSRYADFLWTRRELLKGAHKFARTAAKSYLEAVPLHAEEGNWFEVEDALVRALILAVQVNDESLTHEAQRTVLEWMERLAADKETIRYSLEIAKALPRIRTSFTAMDWERMAVLVDQGAQYYRGEGANELLEQQYHGARVELLKRAGVPAPQLASARLAQAEAREHAARIAGGRSRLVEADLLLDAIAAYETLGATDKVVQLKREMAEALDAGKAEFTPVSATVQLPAGDVDVAIAALTEGGAQEALARMALHAVPSLIEAEKSKASIEAQSPVSHLFGRTILRGGNIVYRGGSDSERAETITLEYFQQAYRFNLAILVGPALDQLRAQGLGPDEVIGILERASWYTAETLAVVRRGLRLYFEGRYLESVYVLLPQIEDMLRQAVRALGGATTAYRRRTRGVDEVSLESVLENPAIERQFGRDYVAFSMHTLADPRGENLRNEVAHGLLKESTDDRLLADLALVHVILLGLPKALGGPGEL